MNSTKIGKSLYTGSIFLPLLGIILTLAGGFILYSSGNLLWFWYDSQSWVEVPSQIKNVALLSKEKRNNSNNRRYTVYKAEAEYTYIYNGSKFTGNRVSVNTSYSSPGTAHKNHVNQLRSYAKSGESFRCFVNPANPAESLLFRQFPNSILIWTLVGAFMMIAGIGTFPSAYYQAQKSQKEKSLRQKYANQPWMWKPEWAEGRIRTNQKKTFFTVLFFTIFWNAISWPMAFFVILPEAANHSMLLVFFLFPIIGIVLATWTVYQFLLWRKYGESELELVSKPAALGEKFGAIIHTGINIDPQDGFHVTLKNIHVYKTRSGKKTRTHKKVLWENSQTVKKEMLEEDQTRSAIPVYFELPKEAQPTDETNRTNKYIWKVECKANQPGVDYYTEFEVPVIGPTVEIQ